jgi:hypothetical protein
MRTRRRDNLIESVRAVRCRMPRRTDLSAVLTAVHDRRERGLFCLLHCGNVGDRKRCCDDDTGTIRRRPRRVARCDSVMLPNHQWESLVLGLCTTQAAVGVDSDDGVGTTGKAGGMRIFRWLFSRTESDAICAGLLRGKLSAAKELLNSVPRTLSLENSESLQRV